MFRAGSKNVLSSFAFPGARGVMPGDSHREPLKRHRRSSLSPLLLQHYYLQRTDPLKLFYFGTSTDTSHVGLAAHRALSLAALLPLGPLGLRRFPKWPLLSSCGRTIPCWAQICQSGSFSEGHDLGIRSQCQCQA